MSVQPVSIESKAQPNIAETRSPAGSRLLFIDNMRVMLTIQVALFQQKLPK